MKIPQYRQLFESLRQQIVSGQYQEGDLLPSENELATQHQITRVTVRQALDELVKQGYIQKQQGKGSIVHRKQRALGLLSFKGFSEVVQASSTIVLQKPTLKAWDTDFFYPLTSQEQQAGCIFLKRLRLVDMQPVMLEYTYIPNLDLPGLSMIPFVNDSLFETLRSVYHVEMTAVEQEIRAILPDETSQQWLQTSAPVLHILRRYKTNRTGLWLYSSLYGNTETYAFSHSF